jgi:hypothetical protein
MAAILTNGVLKIPHRASHAPEYFRRRFFAEGTLPAPNTTLGRSQAMALSL